MFYIVLFEPEIPPNTGNIMRLCNNTGCCLHLIEPLGFDLDDKKLRRAGLDYRDYADIVCHENFEQFVQQVRYNKLYTFSTHNTKHYTTAEFQKHDALVFGPETRGLPPAVRTFVPDTQQLTIPMRASSRSLNLANSVAVAVFEAWRQNFFEGHRHELQ